MSSDDLTEAWTHRASEAARRYARGIHLRYCDKCNGSLPLGRPWWPRPVEAPLDLRAFHFRAGVSTGGWN